MKRLALVAIVILLSACGSSDVSFEVRNGLCYRIREQYTMGMRTDKSVVLALPQNCGLAPGVIAPATPVNP